MFSKRKEELERKRQEELQENMCISKTMTHEEMVDFVTRFVFCCRDDDFFDKCKFAFETPEEQELFRQAVYGMYTFIKPAYNDASEIVSTGNFSLVMKKGEVIIPDLAKLKQLGANGVTKDVALKVARTLKYARQKSSEKLTIRNRGGKV